jgi:hypothetical protein
MSKKQLNQSTASRPRQKQVLSEYLQSFSESTKMAEQVSELHHRDMAECTELPECLKSDLRTEVKSAMGQQPSHRDRWMFVLQNKQETTKESKTKNPKVKLKNKLGNAASLQEQDTSHRAQAIPTNEVIRKKQRPVQLQRSANAAQVQHQAQLMRQAQSSLKLREAQRQLANQSALGTRASESQAVSQREDLPTRVHAIKSIEKKHSLLLDLSSVS